MSSCRTSRPRFPLPDFSAPTSTRRTGATSAPLACSGGSTGTTSLDDQFDLSGDATGWGLNLSSNLKSGKNDVLRMQFAFGEGIQNYMNDSPVDIGIVNDLSNPVDAASVGEPIPIIGIVAVPRSHLEREVHAARSATRARTTTTPTGRRLTPSGSASTRSATCSITRSRT